MEDDYCGQTTNTETKIVDFDPETMRHMVVVCINVTLFRSTPGKVVAKLSSLIYT